MNTFTSTVRERPFLRGHNFGRGGVSATCLVLAAGFGATACSSSQDGADTVEVSQELRNDAAAAGLLEGTADARAIVALVNDRALARRDYVTSVGLQARTAQAIIDVRDGDDRTKGTADDDSFETLAEIDALPLSNAASFGKLLAYAKSKGDKYFPSPIAPTDPASCTGAPISTAKLQALFGNGTSRVDLPAVKAAVYKRDVNALGIGGPWSELPELKKDYVHYDRNGMASAPSTLSFSQAIPILTLGAGAAVRLHFASASALSAFSFYDEGGTSLDVQKAGVGFAVNNCTTEGGNVTCPPLQVTDYTTVESNWNGYYNVYRWTTFGPLFSLKGNVTDTCFRVSATSTSATSETMLVILGSL